MSFNDFINATTVNSRNFYVVNEKLKQDHIERGNIKAINIHATKDTTLEGQLEVHGYVIKRDNLDVIGNIGIGTTNSTSKLHVIGSTKLDGSLDVNGATKLNSTLNVSGATTLNNTLRVKNPTTLDDTLDVTGATTLNNTLRVKNPTTLEDKLDVSGTTFLNTLRVKKVATLYDQLDVFKHVGFRESLNVMGTTNMYDRLTVDDEVLIFEGLTVYERASFADNIYVGKNTILQSILDVTGATTLKSILDVSGATTLKDTLRVKKATTLDDTLDVSGATTLKDTLRVKKATTLDDTLDVFKHVEFRESLNVSGTTNMYDRLTVRDEVLIFEGLSVYERASFADNIYVGKNTILQSILDVSGATTLKDTLRVKKATTLENTLDVIGTTTLNDTLRVKKATTLDDTLDVSGATTLEDTLDVRGATTLNNTLDVSGATTLEDTLDVSGATTLEDTLDVSGATTLEDTLDVSGATTLEDTLDVSGATTLSNTLLVKEATTLEDTLDVSGATTLSNTLLVKEATTLSNTLLVKEATTLEDTLDVSEATTLNNTLDVSGATTLKDTLRVKKATTLENTLNVSGKTTIHGNTEIKGDLHVIGNVVKRQELDVSGNVDISGHLIVDEIVAFNNTLDVSGATTLNNILLVKEATTLEDTLDVKGLTTMVDISAINVDLSGGDLSIFGNIGVSTTEASASVHINTNDAIIIPVGTESQKPTPAVKGMIRFNTTLNQFEGFGVGNEWGSLGGVIDIDQDTKILAEKNPDEDSLVFITAGKERLVIDNSGNFDLSGNMSVEGNIDILGSEIKGNNIHIINDISGNKGIFNDIELTGNITKDNRVIEFREYVNNIRQTYKEVVTQQPSKFNFVSAKATSSKITLDWNYDDILVKDASGGVSIYNSIDDMKSQMLPMIDKICIEISGTTHSGRDGSNEWVPLNYTDNFNNNYYDSSGCLLISGSYNTNKYKQLIVTKYPDGTNTNTVSNILSQDGKKIQFRVYGKNFASNNPNIETRALIFDISGGFKTASTPPKPNFKQAVITNNSIAITYDVSATEIGKPDSAAVIISGNVEYNQIDGSSNTLSVIDTNSSVQDISSNISGNVGKRPDDFTLTLSDLKFGTKYSFKTKVRNNLNTDYSDFSDTSSISDYTIIPTSSSDYINSISITDTSFKTKVYQKNTPNSGLNQNVTFLNINTTDTFKPKFSNSTQSLKLEFTKHSATKSDSDGYGKFVIDKLLSEFTLKIDSQQSQKISIYGYDNFDDTSTKSLGVADQNNTLIQVSDVVDIYSSDNNKKGFRIGGKLELSNISSSSISSNGSSSPIPIQYIYTSSADISNNGCDNTFNVYVDNITTNPSVTTTSGTTDKINVESVHYIMGIPSVKTISFSINRDYSNLSSTNNLFHENIASISISNTSKSSSQILKSATIGSNLSSNISFNWSDSNNPLNGTTHYYTSNINSATQLNIAEKVYSLKDTNSRNGKSVNTQLNPNHYSDRLSISISANSYPTNVIEIDVITSLNSLNSLSSSAITINNGTTPPTNLPKNHTMLFINGNFQFNTTVDYPNVASYEWDSKHTSLIIVQVQQCLIYLEVQITPLDING